MMNLCLIAIDRYFVIVKPMQAFYRIQKLKVIVTSEILVWILSSIVNFPLLLIVRSHKADNYMCEFAQMNTILSIYFIIFDIILYIIPSIIIVLIYWQIIKHQQSYLQPGQTLQQDSEHLFKKKKFIRMLISITLCYILTTWPFFATVFGVAVTKASLLKLREQSTISFLLAFFSYPATTSITVLNPFIYFKFDCNIRNKALQLLRRVNISSNENSITPKPSHITVSSSKQSSRNNSANIIHTSKLNIHMLAK
ncbi:Somatostatin receptor type 5 [Trichoplax sp. H2]|nr:Somatostatin receptor type 5 [Trichoplax sp. H2]|eukprot:RDD39729.1 Somatostatin receptor type 5 [Trichoplax sp. H2]